MVKAAKEVSAQASATDKAKLVMAGTVLIASLTLFYYFSDESLFYRVLGVVAGLLVASGLFFTTAQGQVVSSFLTTARTELQKVVWPTKTETMQTTLIVFVVVLIVAAFLWLLDRLLSWFMQWLIG